MGEIAIETLAGSAALSVQQHLWTFDRDSTTVPGSIA